ncbi:UNVERIFIED_CONTAM: hypothetical protein FKN15_035722 [Acipenser sinensis]
MQALLYLDPEEPCDFHTLSTALQRRFGQVESAVSLRNLLATCKRASGEKLGILAADTEYLARRRYLGLLPAVQEDLAMEAFIRGLNPTMLRQHFWLVAPTSLEQGLTHALRIEAVLEESERVQTTKVCAVRGKEDSDRDEDTAAVRQTMPVRCCWNCGSPGHLHAQCHLRRHPVPSEQDMSPVGNEKGAA